MLWNRRKRRALKLVRRVRVPSVKDGPFMAEDPIRSPLQHDIGDNLKRVYEGALVTDVDELFELLLEKLKKKKAKG